MAYIKTNWEDLPSEDTPIVSTALNNIENGIEEVDTVVNSGWVPLTGTFTYSSADSPTFVMSTSVDLTGIVGLGMRIKLTQTTTKYFIVTAITSNSITMYGGTDYTLTSDAISNVYYSIQKAPFGFPMSPAKWSVVTSSESNVQQLNPTTNTWYNLGSLSISIPIGVWKTYYTANVLANRSTAGTAAAQITLSTANNSRSNANLTAYIFSGSVVDVMQNAVKHDTLTLAAKTTYYLNARSTVDGLAAIFFWGTAGTTIIRAECAYL